MKAAIPANESGRLQALRRYAILDTPREGAFDRITHLAARLLKVPVVQVTLVDEDRGWFKSCYGYDAEATERKDSFCAHAILTDATTIVRDATLDARFADNRFVTGEPHIRFYAGVPLKSVDGFNLGAFCVSDSSPHEFSAEQEEILRDCADLVMDELHLRLAMRERSQQATAIANLSSGVVVTDPNQPDNPIVFCNDGFSTITGYSSQETVGHNCRFLQGPQSDPAVVNELRSAIKEGRAFHGLLLNYRKNGDPFWNELSICPVSDKDGKLINFVGLQNDVTERKRAEDVMKESFDKLQQAEAMRDSLASMIVHDLRSPLTAILLSIGLLKKKSGATLSRDDAELLNSAQESTVNLIKMVSELLDVSRLEEGKMHLEIEEQDLATLVLAAAKPLEPLLGKRRFEIAGGEPVTARCDGRLVERIIGNLLGNALKFTPEDGLVRITLKRDGTQARVSVTDNGRGIPAEFCGRVFEKFGQVKDDKFHIGTGLGLTFCKLAAEAQGGRIGLKSEVGEGSTFWFELPTGKC